MTRHFEIIEEEKHRWELLDKKKLTSKSASKKKLGLISNMAKED